MANTFEKKKIPAQIDFFLRAGNISVTNVLAVKNHLKNPEAIKALYKRFLDNQYSEQDLDELLVHFHGDHEVRTLRLMILAELKKELPAEETAADISSLISRVDENIMRELTTHRQPVSHKKVVPLVRWLSIAAAVMLFGMVGIYIVKNRINDKPQAISKNQQNDVIPGTNKAVLILANGKKINLNDVANGQLAKQAGISIQKTSTGQLVYMVNVDSNNENLPVEYNTAETPRGGQYQINLSDGTRVWLNAGSVIKYPTRFTGKERRVELTGEAYFEVVKNKAMPFKVKTAQQEVDVLGTHFNVNAYADEPATKTTLLEGSVKVTGKTGQKMLKPGQQSVLNRYGLNISEANTEEAVAWKNGYFRFNDERIESIMRKLSYWYNVDVYYEGNISQEEYNGTISRNKNISQVLNMLSSTKTVHFKVEGRRVTVMQ